MLRTEQGHHEDLCSSELALWLQGALKFEGAFISVPFYLTRPTVHPGSKGSGASIGFPAVHLLCYTYTILDCPQRQDVREIRDHLLHVQVWAASFSVCVPFKENILLVHFT